MRPEKDPGIQPPADAEPEGDEERRLLERVLQETIDSSHAEAYALIRDVARQSAWGDSTRPEAVAEVVRAIISRRLGARTPPASLVRRVAASLMEIPEAVVRLERIWQEARSR